MNKFLGRTFVYCTLLFFSFVISGCSDSLFPHTYKNYDLNVTDVNVSTHSDLVLEDSFYSFDDTFKRLEKDGVDNDNFVIVISLSGSLINGNHSIDAVAISESSTYLKSEDILIQKLDFGVDNYVLNPSDDFFYYRIYISSNSLRESKYLENVQDIYFKIDYTIESTVNIPEGFTYSSNKVVIKASDIKKILDDRGVVYE